MWTLRWLMALALVVATAHGVAAEDRAQDRRPATSAAERQARGETAAKQFVQGRYDEALATYLDLYVQSGGRPEYLRNIGRCQQKLKQYDRAVESLKDYLQRARNLSAAERTEVQAFIAEMDAAKAADGKVAQPIGTGPAPAPSPPVVQSAAIQVAPPSTPIATREAPPVQPSLAPPSAPLPQPVASPPPSLTPAIQPGAAPVLITQTQEPTPNTPPFRGLKTGGVVALIGAGLLAVGGTAMLLASQSTYDKAKDAGCPGADATMCDQKANSVNTSIQISMALYISAGVVGAAGVTMLLLPPGPGSTEPRLGMGGRFNF